MRHLPGTALILQCYCTSRTLVLYWYFTGTTLVLYWYRPGPLVQCGAGLELPSNFTGTVLVQYQYYIVSAPLWRLYYFGTVLGLYWYSTCTTLVLHWTSAGSRRYKLFLCHRHLRDLMSMCFLQAPRANAARRCATYAWGSKKLTALPKWSALQLEPIEELHSNRTGSELTPEMLPDNASFVDKSPT